MVGPYTRPFPVVLHSEIELSSTSCKLVVISWARSRMLPSGYSTQIVQEFLSVQESFNDRGGGGGVTNLSPFREGTARK